MNTLKTYPQIQAIPKTQESYAEMMRNSCDIETRSNSVANFSDYVEFDPHTSKYVSNRWWWDSSYSTSYHHY